MSEIKMINLFIDLDGVLADFDLYYEQQFGSKIDRTVEDPPDFWDKIEAHGSFYADLPELPDAQELWWGAKGLHPKPVILTGIPYSITNAEEHKRRWVAEHIEANALVICGPSKDKWKYGKAGDILVDDWQKYRHLWEEMGGMFILHKSAADSLIKIAEILNG